MSRLSVGPMARRHLRQVMAIDEQVYPQPWSRKLWLLELDREQRIYLVATNGGDVVGYAGAMFVPDDVHIMTVVARPESQRQGVATRLLLVLLRAAVAQGSRAATLEVRLSNNGAQALYARFGMEPAGLRPGYYEPDREDALVMWVHDIDKPAYTSLLDQIGATLERAA